MRLNLYWRGRDVIDVELHAWRKRDDSEPDQGPSLQAVGHLQDSSRAEPMEPDTAVFGFATRPESAASPLYRALPHSGTAAHVPATPNASGTAERRTA